VIDNANQGCDDYNVFTKYSKTKRREAFSLIEVVLALGVITFACVILLGLLSLGLVTVTHAVSNTVEAQIVQAVINNSEVQTYTNAFQATNYFNNEGTAVSQTDPTMVYTAKINGIPLTNSTSAPTYAYATNSASMLQVSVINRTTPNVTNVFSLVWSNSGK
jgi:uncharacterized protein (TIGR02598 family)